MSDATAGSGATPVAAPYGTWSSPIDGELVASAHGSLTWVAQADGALWWVESRPADGGRLVLMREGDGVAVQVTAAGANVRTRLHEYGGLPWAAVPATPEGSAGACYTEWSDQRLYLQPLDGGAPRPLTPEPPFEAAYRYAEPFVVGDEVWATRESHADLTGLSVTRDFVAVALDGSAADDPRRVRVLGGGESSGGHHFLAGLRLSPDGSRAAWIGWNHPSMPWDETELVVADVRDGLFAAERVIAGGHRDDVPPVAGVAPSHTPGAGISICQVEWEDDDTVLFLSDATGWFELYRANVADSTTVADDGPAPVTTLSRELGGPLWRVGSRWFAPLGSGRHGVLSHGEPHVFDESDGTLTAISSSDSSVAAGGLPKWTSSLTAVDGVLASAAYGPTSLSQVVTWRDGTESIATHGGHGRRPVLGDGRGELAAEWLPEPHLTWFTDDEGNAVPTNVYPPTNPLSTATEGELPPFVVHIHGGPTGENGVSLDLELAYFTSRGIGVAVPEYGGSTGFGRAWRERLNGAWGVVDIADAATVASGLVDAGIADPARLLIRGGSAGGFTTALALTTPSPFVAGCAQYPVLDLVAFTTGDTHDLESQYMIGLIGELSENGEAYQRRSPSNHAAGLHGPLLIQQGLDDRICLPSITKRFVDELEAVGADYRYTTFEGEQHGFRRAETVRDAITEEFRFLAEAIGVPKTAADLGRADTSDHGAGHRAH